MASGLGGSLSPSAPFGYLCPQRSAAGEREGNGALSGPLFPGAGQDIELHPGGGGLQRLPAGADPRHPAAGGGAGRPASPSRAQSDPADRSRPGHAAPSGGGPCGGREPRRRRPPPSGAATASLCAWASTARSRPGSWPRPSASSRTRIPGFEFGLAEAASADLLERMMAGELDSAILVEPAKPPERLDRWRLFGERYVVLCPEGHPLPSSMRSRRGAGEGEPRRARRAGLGSRSGAGRGSAPPPGSSPSRATAAPARISSARWSPPGSASRSPASTSPAGPVFAARPWPIPRPAPYRAGRGRRPSSMAPCSAAFLKLMRARDWRRLERQLSKP